MPSGLCTAFDIRGLRQPSYKNHTRKKSPVNKNLDKIMPMPGSPAQAGQRHGGDCGGIVPPKAGRDGGQLPRAAAPGALPGWAYSLSLPPALPPGLSPAGIAGRGKAYDARLSWGLILDVVRGR